MTMDATIKNAVNNFKNAFASFNADASFNSIQYDSEGRHFTGLNEQLLSVEAQRHQYTSSRWLSEAEIGREGITIPESAEPAELVMFTNSGIDENGETFVYNSPVMTTQKYYNLSALEIPVDSRFAALREVRIHDISNKEDLLSLLSPNPDQELIDAVSANDHNFCLRRIRDIAENPSSQLPPEAQEYFTWQICTDFGIRYQPRTSLQFSGKILEVAGKLRRSLYSRAGIDLNRQLKKLTVPRRSLNEVISSTVSHSQNNEYGTAIQNRIAEKTSNQPQAAAERQNASMQESSQDVQNRTDGKSEIEKGTIHNRNLNGRPDHQPDIAITAAVSYIPEQRNISIQFSGIPADECRNSMRALGFEYNRQGRIWYLNGKGSQEDLQEDLNRALEMVKSYGYEIKSQNGPEIQSGISAMRPGSDSQEHPADAGGHGVHEAAPDVVSGDEELEHKSDISDRSTGNLAGSEVHQAGNEPDDRHSDTGLRDAGDKGPSSDDRDSLRQGTESESGESDARYPSAAQTDSSRGAEGSSAPDVHSAAGKGPDDDHNKTGTGIPVSGSVEFRQKEPLQDNLPGTGSSESGLGSEGLGDVPLSQQQDRGADEGNQAGSQHNSRRGSMAPSGSLSDEQNVIDGKSGESSVAERGGSGDSGNEDDGDAVQDQSDRDPAPALDTSGAGREDKEPEGITDDASGTDREHLEGTAEKTFDSERFHIHYNVFDSSGNAISGDGIENNGQDRQADSRTSGISDSGRTVPDGAHDSESAAGSSGRNDGPDVSDSNQDGRTVSGSNGESDSLNQNNYVISSDPVKAGEKQQIIDNLNALELALQIQEAGKPASPEEKQSLAKFTGFGSLPVHLYPELRDRYNSVLSRIYPDNEVAKQLGKKQTNDNAFFTSHSIIDLIYSKLEESGFKGGNVLEPSCGSGNFIGSAPESLRNHVRFTGVEVDPAAALIAKALYPDAEIENKGIEHTVVRDFYDVTVGNVPFSKGAEDLSDTSLKDFLHFARTEPLPLPQLVLGKAVQETRPGGIIAMIVPKGIMNNDSNRTFRIHLSRQAEFCGAVRIPQGGFDRTDTDVDLIFLKRREHEVSFDPKTHPDQIWADSIPLGKILDTREEYTQKGELAANQPQIVTSKHSYKDQQVYSYTDDSEKKISIRYDRNATELGLAKQSINAYYAQNLERFFPSGQMSLFFEEEFRNSLSAEIEKKSGLKIAEYLKSQISENVHFDYKPQEIRKEAPEVLPQTKEQPANRIYIENGEAKIRTKSGEVQDIKTSKGRPLPKDKIELLSGLLKLRDTASKLYSLQQSAGNDDPTIMKLRQNLNDVYQELADKYDSKDPKQGVILPNKRFFLKVGGKNAHEADALADILFSLEKTRIDDKTQKVVFDGKAAIFDANTVSMLHEPRFADSDEEALIISQNTRGRIDIDYIARLRKSTPENIVKSYLDKKLIYRDPETYDPAKPLEGFVSRDDYLYGDLYMKIQAAKKAHFDENVKDLEASLPPRIPANEIAVQIGQTWIPEKYYAQFLQQVVEKGLHGSPEQELKHRAGRITKAGDMWAVDVLKNETDLKTSEFDSNEYKRFYPANNKVQVQPYEIFENLLNGFKQPIWNPKIEKDKFHNDTRSDEQKAADNKIIQQDSIRMAQAVANMQAAFKQWIFADPERAADLEKIYNEKFNTVRPKDYAAMSENLVFHGMSSDIKLRDHQKQAIMRILHGDCNQLLAHCTGAGKTYEMIAAAVEAQRLGLASKQILVFPKQVVGQASESFQKLYPGLEGTLIATPDDLKKDNRQAFLGKCLDPDVHFIVMTQEQFRAIPQDQEWIKEMNNRELLHLASMVNVFEQKGKADPAAHRMVTRLRRRMETLQRKQNKITTDIQKGVDDGITFQQLGIDRIFVDEAHAFKNLNTDSKRSEALSINGSKRADDMLQKCSYLNEHNKRPCVIFSTATPISNSVVELYNMVRYLTPEKFLERGIYSVDSFANNYLSDRMGWEPKIDGTFAPNVTPDKWQNPDDLMNIIRDSWDILSEADLRKSRQVKLPASHLRSITVPTSDIQTALMKEIFKRGQYIRSGSCNPRVDNMLKISSDSRKLSLDERLILSDYLLEKQQIDRQKENLELARVNPSVADAADSINSLLSAPAVFFKDAENDEKDRASDVITSYRGFDVSLLRQRQVLDDNPDKVKYDESFSAILHNPAHGEDTSGDIRLLLVDFKKSKNNTNEDAADDEGKNKKEKEPSSFEKIDHALDSLGTIIQNHEQSLEQCFALPAQLERLGVLAKDIDNPSSKVNLCADVIAKTYQNNKDPDGLGTQLVFLDQSVNKNKAGLSIYDNLRKKLEERGIPANEIAVAGDYKNAPGSSDDEKKRNFFDRVKNGKVKVLIGSTQKIGTGVNVQDHIVAMHHLDIPWRPSDVEQRNGRGIRQGNLNSDVNNYFYITKGTFDEIGWHKLRVKKEAIDGLLQRQASSIRKKELDVGDSDGSGVLSIDDFRTMEDNTSAHPEQVKLRQSEETLQNLDISAKEFIGTKSESQKILDGFAAKAAELQNKIDRREAEKALRDSSPQSLKLLNADAEITTPDEIKKALLSLKKADLSAFSKIDETALSEDGKEHESIYHVGTYRGFNLNFIVTEKRDMKPVAEIDEKTNAVTIKEASGDIVKSYELQLQHPNNELRSFETALRDPKNALDELLRRNIDDEINKTQAQLRDAQLTQKTAATFMSKAWDQSDEYLKELQNCVKFASMAIQSLQSKDRQLAQTSISEHLAIFEKASGKSEAEIFDLLNENGQMEKLGFKRPYSAAKFVPHEEHSAGTEQRDSEPEADVRADTSSADEPVSLESLFNTVVETTNELNQHKTEWEQQSPGAKSIFDYLDSQFQFPIVMGIPEDQGKQVLEQLANFAYKWKVSPNAMKDILSDELNYRENKVKKNWPDPIDLHRKKLQFLSNYNVYAHSGSTPIFNNGSAFHKAEEDAFDSLLHNQLRPLLGIKENEQVKESVQPEVESNSESIAEQLDDAVNEARKQPGNEVSKEDEHLARLQQQLSAGQSKQSEGEESPNTVSEEPHQESAAPAPSEAPEKPREQSGRWAENVTSFAGMEVHVISPDADDTDRIAAKFNELDNEYFAKRNAKLGINENQAEDEQQTNAVNESGREAAPEADTGLAPAKQEPQSVEKSAADQQSAAIDDAFSSLNMLQTETGSSEKDSPVTVEKKAAQGPEAAVNQPAEVRLDEEPKSKEKESAAEQYDEKVLLITQKIISDPFSQHKYPRIEAFHDGNLLRKAAFNLAGFAVKWGIEPENMKAILDKELSGYQLSHQPEITLGQLRLLGNLDTEDKKRFEEFKKDHPGKFTEKSGYLHYRRERSREFKAMMDEHIRPILGITVEGILNQAEAYTGSRLVPSSSARDCENTHVKAALKTSGNKFIATNELVLSIAVAMNSTARSMTVKSFFSQFEKATDIADDLLRKDAIALDFEEANGKRLSVRCFPVSDIDFVKLHEKYPQLETALEFLKPENGQYWLQNHPARSEEIKLYFQKHLQDVYAPSTKGFYTLTPGAARIHNFSQISEICEHSYKKEMEEIFNHYGVYPRFISRAHVSSEVDSFGKVVDDASGKVIVEGKNAVDKKNIKQVPDSQPKEGGKAGLCLS